MYLYLMRHGETNWNQKGLIQGATDIPLNENGIELAEVTRDGLQAENVHFDHIFSSPFIRAKKTAEIIAAGEVPVICDDRIHEMNFGAYEGVPLADVMSKPEYENIHNFFVNPEAYVAEEGCESYEDATKRLASFYEEVLVPNTDKWENCLIVCHGAIIRTFFAYLCGKELNELWDIKIANCSMNIFEITKEGAALIEMGKLYYPKERLAGRRYV